MTRTVTEQIEAVDGFPVIFLPGPRAVRLVSSARLRDPVLSKLFDTEEERSALEEIDAATSGRLVAGVRGTVDITIGEFVANVPHAAFVNAAFAYFRPRERNRFNGNERGAWYASLSGVETCVAEITFHMEREFERIGDYNATVHYAELFTSFAGSFVDLKDAPKGEGCLHPDPAIGYAAGNKLADEVRRLGINGIVYPSVRHEGGTNLVAVFAHAVQSVTQGKVLELKWQGEPGPTVSALTG